MPLNSRLQSGVGSSAHSGRQPSSYSPVAQLGLDHLEKSGLENIYSGEREKIFLHFSTAIKVPRSTLKPPARKHRVILLQMVESGRSCMVRGGLHYLQEEWQDNFQR